MVELKDKVALIVGAGSGLSASIARVLAKAGMRIALAARSIDDLSHLAGETGAKAFACDATAGGAVKRLFADVAQALGDPHAVVYIHALAQTGAKNRRKPYREHRGTHG
jgi:NADP-dependent 3-hydroxy acid dehydrogenase YdfG